ncbi:hypothetical protein BpHYR1_028948 [Brachionus plicatilis]|uniref:Uncharacterized protein n=1 Tax=Brachionus plicatilis TaxID=10195 RepID=A0A3M7PR71_BRAPC|nr:hypothetical protein BpHYR1_028948 [Brachionus plicatilis]
MYDTFRFKFLPYTQIISFIINFLKKCELSIVSCRSLQLNHWYIVAHFNLLIDLIATTTFIIEITRKEISSAFKI